MSTHSKWLSWSAALIGTMIFLAACGDKPPAASPSSPPAAAPSDGGKPAGSGRASAAIASLSVEPAAAVLAPGAKLSLKVSAVGGDQHKKELAPAQGVAFTSSKADIVVSPDGVVTAAAQAKTGSTATITVSYQGVSKDVPVTIKYSLTDTLKPASAGALPTVTNPTDLAVVVNKQRALPSDYVPPDLVEPKVPFSFKEKSEKKMMRSEAAAALEKLFEQAEKDKIKLYGISAYRSYATQKAVFASNVKTQGEQEASQYSARPGQSEHQTGLAIDVSSQSAKLSLEEVFATTPEGKWLAANASAFGFIIRYPKGKEAITGYAYEPWHIRYVGTDAAREISEKGITLEEYFQDAVPVTNPPKAK